MQTATLNASLAIETPNFGNGRYAGEMERLYKQSQALLGFTPQQAEKFARQAATDAGVVLKDAKATIKVGRGNSDNKGTISDASKAKGVSLTNALNLVHTIDYIGDAGKHGISYGHTTWKLSEPLQEYADGLAETE